MGNFNIFGYSIDAPVSDTVSDTAGKSGADASSKQTVHLVSPPELNYTDPVVRHDVWKDPCIAVQYDPEYAEYDPSKKLNHHEAYDQQRVFGKIIPVIKVNNLVVDIKRIAYFKLDYRGIVPKLTLDIVDDTEKIKTQDMPARKNSIDVVIVPQQEGAYKKISLKFYIDNVPERLGNIIRYANCELDIPELYESRPRTYTYQGCSNADCNASKNDKPNFYELMHEIALFSGLGFQTTKEVKEIEDRLSRNTQNMRLCEFIAQQLSFAGLGNGSIFDMWIDLYGYITIVNVPWVMSQDIDYRYISIKALNGTLGTSETTPEPTYMEVNRTLTNFNAQSARTNLTYRKYERIVNYNDLVELGTIQNIRTFARAGDPIADEGVGGNNMGQVNVQAGTSSYVEDDRSWEREAPTKVITEVNEYPTGTQKVIRDLYFKNLRVQQLKVELDQYNLGLQRGTLVNFMAFTNDPQHKQKIATNMSALGDPKKTTKVENNSPEELSTKDRAMSDHVMIPDLQVSGMYYIDGMEFIYTPEDQEIKQYLYLLPKDVTNTITNELSLPAHDPEVTEEMVKNAKDGGDQQTSSKQDNRAWTQPTALDILGSKFGI